MIYRIPTFFIACSLGIIFNSAHAAPTKPTTEIIAYQVKSLTQSDTLQVLGTLRAFQSAQLSAPVSEQIQKIHIKDGQIVEKGKLLYEFHDLQQQALLKEAQLEVIETNRQHKRLLDIKEKGSSLVTQAQIDEKQTAWQISLAKQKNIEVQITDRKIFAPFKGQLGFSDLSIGNRIEAGQTLISLDDYEVMKLDVLIPVRYLSEIYLNQTIQVQTEAYPDSSFKGVIMAIAPQLEAQSRMVQVRAHIDNREQKLKTNMMVKAQVDLADKQGLFVPNTAILMLGDHNFIFRLNPNEKGGYQAEKVTVKVGQVDEELTEIKVGLAEGDIVVSQGVMRVKDRAVVKIKAYENNLSQERLLQKNSTSNQQQVQ